MCQHVIARIEANALKRLTVLTHQHPKARKLVEEQARQGSSMAVYVDLSQYWTDPKNPTIEEAHRKTGLDKRTLSAARKGQLERSQFETLFTLKDFASELAGKRLTLEEIFKKTKEQ